MTLLLLFNNFPSNVPVAITDGGLKPKLSKMISPKGYVRVERTDAQFQNTSTVYNSSTTTYNSSSQVYGGSDKRQKRGPRISKVGSN